MAGQVFAVEGHGPGRRLEQPREDAHQRRLARAVGTQHGDGFRVLDMQLDLERETVAADMDLRV